ncbi:hypothetical protein TOPH_06934 [Tolypocladium ophioglossoides CBS 100239]|uniref:Uncharacterized protein n=1 Tax=Tolypocladium ophioglossoides (strain CBS 100239) TaxID=1163406 RepID=A0A0L0N2H8_TOLOC|nr:hypothetical protein TOPH_06934 [Tolypocladium ophioglossoides CBS 100239]
MQNNMKFGISVLLLASAFGAIAELLPELHLANDKGIDAPKGIRAPRDGVDLDAVCPPDFPRYCPIGGFCCYTLKCCSKSCCQNDALYCIDGHCYK